LIANSNQTNADGDSLGDVCDDDDDGDGVADGADNCPLIANSDQANVDGDSFGDVCDEDDDADGIGDGADNCPVDANPQQFDADVDGIGDACDATNSSLVAIPVSHTSLPALWLMALLIAIIGGRGIVAIRRGPI
jgi:hypothetical protein